jgi:hypothetical protein
MDELRVPTVALAAEVLCADGRRFRGRIFVPAAAPTHAGPTRAEDWMNESPLFFPFLPEEGGQAVLLNKRETLVVTVAAETDAEDLAEEATGPLHRVAVEAEGARLEGIMVVTMPEGHSRVLDYLNRPQRFLTLREGERHHLIQKERITRVLEIAEE